MMAFPLVDTSRIKQIILFNWERESAWSLNVLIHCYSFALLQALKERHIYCYGECVCDVTSTADTVVMWVLFVGPTRKACVAIGCVIASLGFLSILLASGILAWVERVNLIPVQSHNAVLKLFSCK